MGVAHHAAYLPYLETARVEYLRSLGHPYRELRDRDGIEFAVVGVDIRYHAPLRFDDVFSVSCALAARAPRDVQPGLPRGARRPARAERAHAARRARPRDGRPAAPARVAGGCFRSRSRRVPSMPRRLIMLAALAAFLLALPGGALAAAPKPVPVTLAGVLFNGKENPKVTLKLGGSLRFVWKEGFHNVLTRRRPRRPTGSTAAPRWRATSRSSSSPRRRASTPSTAHRTRRSAWCSTSPSRSPRPAAAAHQLRPPSVETSSSPSGAMAYQMRSLRGSEATIVARGPLRCHVAP